MRLFFIGCEYAGTTTLAVAIRQWAKEEMGIDLGASPRPLEDPGCGRALSQYIDGKRVSAVFGIKHARHRIFHAPQSVLPHAA